MNWDALGAIGEIVGAAGVVASLFYVGFQIRQNTIHARAYTQRDIISELTRDHLIGGEKSRLYRKALSNFSAIDEDEKLEAHAILSAIINRFEATLRLHNTGLVDNSLFAAHRAWALAHILSPGGIQWWRAVRHNISEDARHYLDREISEGINLPSSITAAMPFFGIEEGNERGGVTNVKQD